MSYLISPSKYLRVYYNLFNLCENDWLAFYLGIRWLLRSFWVFENFIILESIMQKFVGRFLRKYWMVLVNSILLLLRFSQKIILSAKGSNNINCFYYEILYIINTYVYYNLTLVTNYFRTKNVLLNITVEFYNFSNNSNER